MNLEDIARKAGVSRSTVSRVINNEPYVSQKTRERVMAIIERENFMPNPAARAMVTRRTQSIGVVVPQTMNVFFGDNSYYPQLLQGMSQAIAERDHSMVLWLQHQREDRNHFIERLSRNRWMDGLVLCSMMMDDPVMLRVIDMGYPFVVCERPAPHLADRVSYVTIDNIAAAETATNHLIELGRRRIAHISGNLSISDGEDRLIGYQRALERAGLPVEKSLIAHGNFSDYYGYYGMKQLLTHYPDAVFAAGDTTAQGAMRAIRDAGLRVPDDIAVVGFDDLDVATQSNPAMTTIRQPVQEKGAAAASLLIDMIEGKVREPRHILLPTELVIRQSSGGIPIKSIG